MSRLLVLLLLTFLCGCAAEPNPLPLGLVPYPNHIETGAGRYDIRGAKFSVDEDLEERSHAAVREFAAHVGFVSGCGSRVTVSGKLPSRGVRFVGDTTVRKEGYRITIGRRGVEVAVTDYRGLLYSIQTLKQLLPVEIYGDKAAPEADWSLPGLKIDDAPRFGYRGMHLDVARHFFPVEEVKRYLDIMHLHKLNTLHWHLTDDQGWRVEIGRYPRLVEVGSVRKYPDGTTYRGHYTRDEIREVVDYAARLGIDVIPEIDLPGHMQAALAAYPELGCRGHGYEVWTGWGVSDEVLCAGKESTFDFLEGVLTEIMELFPSKYIHIGGDECPKVRWQHCPHCQARIAELGLKGDKEYSKEHYLQSYVMSRVGKFLAGHGRRIIGWDEILEGEVPENAVVMSWRSNYGGILAAWMGHDAIMTPHLNFYFNYVQSDDKSTELWGVDSGPTTLEKVYNYDFKGLTDEYMEHVIGVQANMWTEFIPSAWALEHLLLPRLAALSEVQWCMPGVRDWERFSTSFRMNGIYDTMGYNHAK